MMRSKKQQHLDGIQLAKTLVSECQLHFKRGVGPQKSATQTLLSQKDSKRLGMTDAVSTQIRSVSKVEKGNIPVEPLQAIEGVGAQDTKKPSDPKKDWLFCYVTYTVAESMGLDADHLQPYEIFYARQWALAEYLNEPENSEIARAFLGELEDEELSELPAASSEDNKTRKAAIRDYLQRDTDDIIKITEYFVRVALNQSENVLCMMHSVNLEKSSHSVHDFLKKHMPQQLLDYLTKAQVLCDGILFPRVLSSAEKAECRDYLFQGKTIVLHEGKGKALVPAVLKFFETNQQNVDIRSYAVQLKNMQDASTALLKNFFLSQKSSVDDNRKHKIDDACQFMLKSMLMAIETATKTNVDSDSEQTEKRKVLERFTKSRIKARGTMDKNQEAQETALIQQRIDGMFKAYIEIREYVAPEVRSVLVERFFDWLEGTEDYIPEKVISLLRDWIKYNPAPSKEPLWSLEELQQKMKQYIADNTIAGQRAQLQATRQEAAAQLQATRQEAAAQLQATRQEAAAQLQATRQEAAAQLQAAQQAAAAAQQAEAEARAQLQKERAQWQAERMRDRKLEEDAVSKNVKKLKSEDDTRHEEPDPAIQLKPR